MSNPFPKGVILVKRKVASRAYGDDPIGRRSLLSRTLQKVRWAQTTSSFFHMGFLKSRFVYLFFQNLKDDSDGDKEVDKLVSTFSADPSLLAFAQFFCTYRQRRYAPF